MKKFRILLVALLVIAFAAMLTGCYMISGQKMNKVKGTYKLTNYTHTPSYERREGYTPNTRDYINDEKYLYEDYLIVTGTSTGYYVHKSANEPAYVKEVTLSYEYNAEDPSILEYVTYNDAFTVGQSTNNGNHLGVNKNALNFSRPSFDYTELFTGRPMRSEDLYVRWEKVDRATDLSYAKAKVGELKEYDYQSFAVRGIYELNLSTNLTTGETVESAYQYFFYVIDTAKGTTTATVYYALQETPTERVTKTVTFVNNGIDWSTMTIDGVVWTGGGSYYYSESDGLQKQITCVSHDISDSMLESLITSRLPAIAE